MPKGKNSEGHDVRYAGWQSDGFGVDDWKAGAKCREEWFIVDLAGLMCRSLGLPSLAGP